MMRLVRWILVLALCPLLDSMFFFFNDTATTEIYTLSLHDALPISLTRLLRRAPAVRPVAAGVPGGAVQARGHGDADRSGPRAGPRRGDAPGPGRGHDPAGGHGQAVPLRDRHVGDDPGRPDVPPLRPQGRIS